jgi:hypothetical protein
MVIMAFLMLISGENVNLPLSLLTDIEMYTVITCIGALIYSHFAAYVNDEKPTGN